MESSSVLLQLSLTEAISHTTALLNEMDESAGVPSLGEFMKSDTFFALPAEIT